MRGVHRTAVAGRTGDPRSPASGAFGRGSRGGRTGRGGGNPMSDTRSTSALRPAAELTAIEIISGLLVSTVPTEVGQRLAEQLRELTGARTILLIGPTESRSDRGLVAASPGRRATMF